MEIASLGGIGQRFVVEGGGAWKLHAERVGNSRNRRDHLERRTLFVHGRAVVLQLEAFEPRALVGEQREIIVGLDLEFSRRLGLSLTSLRVSQRRLRFRRRRSGTFRRLLLDRLFDALGLFLDRRRRGIVARDQQLVRDEYQ
jgi:hypothetical protein